MYKDKDKQREANRQAQVRFKARMAAGIDVGIAMQKRLGITEGIRSEGITDKVLPERTAQGNIRVSKPGDADYVPMCETTRAFIEGRDKRPETGKRGLDIKCFVDLPPDVQQTISRMSLVDGKIDQFDKAKRTTAAIKYQHIFPDRYHNTGMSRTDSTKGAGV